MKKIAYLVVLINIILFPSMVNAYELKCGTGPYSFNDSFMCTLTGANGISYDELKGTLEENEFVSCIISAYPDGIKPKDANEVSNKFDVAGKSASDDLINFKCQIIGKPNEDKTTQLFINDFTYHDSSSLEREKTEIVRSNLFSIKKYDENATKPVDNKPRDTSNSNSRLKGLAAEGLDFTFSSFITEYHIDVLYEVEQINLLVLPYNLEATYKIVGNQKLEIGDNTIDVYVTSPDQKATTCYTLYIKRLARGQEVYNPEADASLKDLIISGQNITFDKETLEYNININYDVEAVDINAVPSAEGAKVEIVNSTALKNGDVISVIVTSRDETASRRYLIHVNKAPEPYDYSKVITLGVVGGLGLIIIILFMRSSKKSKEDPLLKIKKDKRGINKGENFDPNAVPDASSTVQQASPAPNVIKADDVSVIQPMMIDPNAVDDNRNKITSNVNTLSLETKAMPIAIPVGSDPNQAIPQGPMPGGINNNINPSLPEEEPQQPVNTLDLSGTVAPMPAAETNIFDMPPQPSAPQTLNLNQTQAQPQMAPVEPQPIVQSLDNVQSVSIPVPPSGDQNQ